MGLHEIPACAGMTGRALSARPSDRNEFEVERLGYRLMADLSAGDVEAHGEMRVGLHRGLGALARKLQHTKGRVALLRAMAEVRATAPGMLATQ